MDNRINENLPPDLFLENSPYFKVIGVGNSGVNILNYMYTKGIPDVSFLVYSTNNQNLENSPVPVKIHLGKNTAKTHPEIFHQTTEKTSEEIKKTLSKDTRMAFVVTGMGGETGTEFSPIVAKTAKEMEILTVAIVTIPFAYEGSEKIHHAFQGVLKLSKHVDSIIVINNEKLKEIHSDLNSSNAFAIVDDVLFNTVKDIIEIVTKTGYISIDFDDINTTMKDSKVAIENTGFASGENRIAKAIEDALISPLLSTNDVSNAKRILLKLYCSQNNAIKMEEITQLHEFMKKTGPDTEVIWGAVFDDDLGDKVKVTLIATGFEVKNIIGK